MGLCTITDGGRGIREIDLTGVVAGLLLSLIRTWFIRTATFIRTSEHLNLRTATGSNVRISLIRTFDYLILCTAKQVQMFECSNFVNSII